ncbi:MAG: S-layer homology domain-containing protein [Candidatus Cohnella colombiensis]|uniref:S-layer homology domain-containing protein n=1 Tax=Candidatus Cohnella colombiensis TaxID=3121368 RepID=A0AA95EZM3_9BACL|nr:MAG: S-layer homology domain-containing protein [Cohnella sp.]
MKKLLIILSLISILVMALPNSQSSAASKLPIFSDIENHWAKSAIITAANKGYVNGYPDGTFRPNDRVNVDEFITMMIRSLIEKNSYGVMDWSDAFFEKLSYSLQQNLVESYDYFDPTNINNIKSSTKYWADPYIDQANRMLFLKRNDSAWNNKFNVPLTREKAAYLVMSLLGWIEFHENPGLQDLAWKDIKDKKDVVYTTHVIEAYIKGIISGYPDKTFKPKGYITRAESIALIARIIDNSKRNLHIPDLTGKHYTTVAMPNGDTKYYVFPNAEYNKLYDALDKVKDTAPKGSYLEDARVFKIYYTSKEDYDKMIYQMQRSIYDFQPSVFSVGIGSSDTDFSMSINSKYSHKGYEKIYDTFVNFMFEGKVDQFNKIFMGMLKERKESGTIKPVEFKINNREVKITTVGYDGIVAYVSTKGKPLFQ